MTPSIVCGIDHSDQARAAAHCAAALARRLHHRLILVHAVPPVAGSPMPTWPYPASLGDDRPEQAAHDAARRLAGEIRDEVGAPEAICRIEDGSAVEWLTAVADEEDAALIVLGTQGEGARRTVLLGSVSLATVRAAGRPVVVVPPGVSRRCAAVEGDCVVCGVSGPGDTGPARVAAVIARGLGLPVQLAHVDGPVGKGGAALEAAADAVTGIAALDRIRMLAGDPVEQLSRLADRERAAMVVVGTRARGTLRSALLGSVSRALACSGSTPVVVCSERAVARVEADATAHAGA